MEAFGLDLDLPPTKKDFEIFPENEDAVTFFLMCSTQWLVSFGGYVGLDYKAVFEILKLYDKMSKQLFADIQIMERAALPIMNQAGK